MQQDAAANDARYGHDGPDSGPRPTVGQDRANRRRASEAEIEAYLVFTAHISTSAISRRVSRSQFWAKSCA